MIRLRRCRPGAGRTAQRLERDLDADATGRDPGRPLGLCDRRQPRPSTTPHRDAPSKPSTGAPAACPATLTGSAARRRRPSSPARRRCPSRSRTSRVAGPGAARRRLPAAAPTPTRPGVPAADRCARDRGLDARHATFDSAAFFPQRLATPNYFGALGESGRTSLDPHTRRSTATTRATSRTVARRTQTNSERAYYQAGIPAVSTLRRRKRVLGGNQPALAAPPAITDVQGTCPQRPWSASLPGPRATRSAGVQQVWVTWTGTRQRLRATATWVSVDLQQEPDRLDRWMDQHASAARARPTQGVRFLVQAATASGTVGLDTGGR